MRRGILYLLSAAAMIALAVAAVLSFTIWRREAPASYSGPPEATMVTPADAAASDVADAPPAGVRGEALYVIRERDPGGDLVPDAYADYLVQRAGALGLAGLARRGAFVQATERYVAGRASFGEAVSLGAEEAAIGVEVARVRAEAEALFVAGDIDGAARVLDVAFADDVFRKIDMARGRLRLDRAAVAAAALETDRAAILFREAGRWFSLGDHPAAMAAILLGADYAIIDGSALRDSDLLHIGAELAAEAVSLSEGYDGSLDDAERLRRAAPSQLRLGRALLALVFLNETEKLDGALDAFRAARDGFSKEEQGEDWANAQIGLGAALGISAVFRDPADIYAAPEAFNAAMEVWTYADNPSKWATLQHDLGIVQRLIGQRGDARALRDSVGSFRRAMTVKTREKAPFDFAATSNELGDSLRRLGERGDDDALRDAAAAHEAALEVFAIDVDPDAYAKTQTYLGLALRSLGERGDDEALLRAASAHRASMSVWDSDSYPEYWAFAQSSLGEALAARDGALGEPALDEALAAYREALTFYTPRVPHWANTRGSLAAALISLAKRGRQGALEEAIALARGTLDETSFDLAPASWAYAQHNLGAALSLLGREGDLDAVRQSIEAFQEALRGRPRGDAPLEWAATQREMAAAFQLLADSGEPAASESAIGAFRAALDVYSAQATPLEWAQTQSDLADALWRSGDRAGGEIAARAALQLYRRRDRSADAAKVEAWLRARGLDPDAMAARKAAPG